MKKEKTKSFRLVFSGFYIEIMFSLNCIYRQEIGRASCRERV